MEKKIAVVAPAVLPASERSDAERSEAQRIGEAGNTGAGPVGQVPYTPLHTAQEFGSFMLLIPTP